MPKLTIQFGDEMDKLLKDLASEKHTTQTEIIRRALATYKYLNDELKDEDKRISVRTENKKTIKDVIIP